MKLVARDYEVLRQLDDKAWKRPMEVERRDRDGTYSPTRRSFVYRRTREGRLELARLLAVA